MWLNKLSRLWTRGPATGRRSTPHGTRRLAVEPLEDRTVPSAGTGADTFLVKDLNPGSASSGIEALADLNGTLLLSVNDGLGGGLWKSDGTASGTVRLKDVYIPAGITVAGGTAFFQAYEPTTGYELWNSDGTTAGTVLVKDINPGIGHSGPGGFANVNGVIYFTADDGAHGVELWRSDGTAAGTVLVKDINPGSGGSGVRDLINVNGTLFFTAVGGTSNRKGLWKSDGTTAGTVLIRGDLLGVSNPTNVNGTVFFTAADLKYGMELWKSDGTAAGTTMVKDIYSGSYRYQVSDNNFRPHWEHAPNSSVPSNLVNANGTLLFIANDGTHGRELWKSDGTSKGTVLVKDVNPGATSGTSGPLINANGTWYFTGNDGTSGAELWKTDGTGAGTSLVRDINPGNAGSSPSYLTNGGAMLYFAADDGAHGVELWKSDGTAAGTVLVKDINPGGAGGLSSYPLLTVSGGHLFFAADDGVHGRELWDPVVSLDVGPNVNTSRLPFNQQETTIAINPANPSNLFIASNSRNLHDLSTPLPAQFAAYSMNGGKTWKYVDPKDGTVGDGDDALPTARYDTSAAFDTFGNLFWAYEHYDNPGQTSSTVVVVLSTDGGKTFSVLDLLRPGKSTDHVFLATGPGPGGSGSSVWVSYLGDSPDQTVVQGAPVTGLGAVGAFGPPEKVTGPGVPGQQIAVGPSGQVLVSINGETQTVTTLDPDGLGPAGFGAPQHVTNVKINGRELIPAQPHKGIVADAGLAYDRSSGPHRGRAYMVYNDAVAMGSADTNIFVRYSDDDGFTWSNPVRVNDDSGTNSQFFPRIAVDPTTGFIAVSWYDCRNDLGTGGPGDRDGIPNDDAQFWAAVSTDGGLSFAPNVQVSAGTSSANAAWTGINQDYGDYTGLDFYGGKFYPAWADNSNSTGDNPPGAVHYLDIYTAAVTVTATADVVAHSAAVISAAPVGIQPQPTMLADTHGRRGPLVAFAAANPSPAPAPADDTPATTPPVRPTLPAVEDGGSGSVSPQCGSPAVPDLEPGPTPGHPHELGLWWIPLDSADGLLIGL